MSERERERYRCASTALLLRTRSHATETCADWTAHQKSHKKGKRTKETQTDDRKHDEAETHKQNVWREILESRHASHTRDRSEWTHAERSMKNNLSKRTFKDVSSTLETTLRMRLERGGQLLCGHISGREAYQNDSFFDQCGASVGSFSVWNSGQGDSFFV